MKTISETRHENLLALVRKYNGPGALAKALDKSPSQVSQWINQSPDSKTGKPRQISSVTARFIEEKLRLGKGRMDAADLGSENKNTEPGLDIRGSVPVISLVQAGDYTNVVDNYQPDLGMERIGVTCPIGRHTFSLRVKGDSMTNPSGAPSFPEGIYIVIEPELEAEPGDFVVVKNGDGEATFKQLMRDGSDLYLKALNPSYPMKPFPEDGHIVGVLREATWKFR